MKAHTLAWIACGLALALWPGCRRDRPTRPAVADLVAPTPTSNGALNAATNGPWTFLQHLGPVALTEKSLRHPVVAAFRKNSGGTIKKIIYCAAAKGQEVVYTEDDGSKTVYPGWVGVAPQWLDGPCDTACQEWVSACLAALSNQWQIPVILHLAGEHKQVKEPEEEDWPERYPVQEGAFYGNFFLQTPRVYSCWGEGFDPLYSAIRVCAQPGSRCGSQPTGPCGNFDGMLGKPSTRRACAGYDDKLGAYTDCSNRATLPGSDAFPKGSRNHTRVITSWVKRNALMQVADGATCKDHGAPGEDFGGHWVQPPPDQPAPAGTPCVNDDQCNDPDLFCETALYTGGMCTRFCKDNSSQANEQAQCGGPAATCLAQGDPAKGGSGWCTTSCNPKATTMADGACHSGQVCTGLWTANQFPDSPGCWPWCDDDAQCPQKLICHKRMGYCWVQGADETLRADGEPCVLKDKAGQDVQQCRGGCFNMRTGRNEGICISLVNLGVTKTCADDPDAILPYRYHEDDNIGLCAFRSCKVDGDCTAPLRCQYNTWTKALNCLQPPL